VFSERLSNQLKLCKVQFDDVMAHLKCLETGLRLKSDAGSVAAAVSTHSAAVKDSGLGSSLNDATQDAYGKVKRLEIHILQRIQRIDDNNFQTTSSTQCDCEKRLACCLF